MDKQISKKITNLLLRGRYKQLLVLLFLLVIGGLFQVFLEYNLNKDTQVDLINEGFVKVERVVDGDTFTYDWNGEKRTVRLLGVDTPETVDPRKEVQCFGAEASQISKNLMEGREVRLETDPIANERDKYNREIRYVYLADGRMINRYLVANGYAFATPEYQFSLKQEFVNLEKEANISGKGLWNKSVCN